MDRDKNAARNILSRVLGTVGHTGTFALDASNALGESISTQAGEILPQQIGLQIKESPCVYAGECQDFSTQSTFEEP